MSGGSQSPPPPPPPPPGRKTQPSKAPPPGLMRNLGQFFGHVVQGVKSTPSPQPGAGQPPRPPVHAEPPAEQAPGVVRHEIIERVQDTPGGPVKIRRTIIEEEQVELPRPPLPPTDPSSQRSPHGSAGF